ncbi:hypothetical protein ES703_84512 [subsurface metagenome]
MTIFAFMVSPAQRCPPFTSYKNASDVVKSVKRLSFSSTDFSMTTSDPYFKALLLVISSSEVKSSFTLTLNEKVLGLFISKLSIFHKTLLLLYSPESVIELSTIVTFFDKLLLIPTLGAFISPIFSTTNLYCIMSPNLKTPPFISTASKLKLFRSGLLSTLLLKSSLTSLLKVSWPIL